MTTWSAQVLALVGSWKEDAATVLLGVLGLGAFAGAKTAPARPIYRAVQAVAAPVVDGRATDACWAKAAWRPLDQRWVGPATKPGDFAGRYKVVWTPARLYVLAEITDDKLVDTHASPLDKWWDDDCLEIFVDPDHSGGEHQYNYNAWAYHVALDGHVVDMGRNQQGRLFDSHVQSRHTQAGRVTTWETSVALYADSYDETRPATNRPLTIRANQPIGFALAYCDNDASAERENFFGSVPIAGTDKNRGWIDAGVFGTLLPVGTPAAALAR
ncbi:CBM9 family sugar-binding protein [Hymenobacter sp. BT175]|uniref:CBM9 family sugar-binding protein n=1 Tax=Hymenobacter translucens TaxID=2886507 RepID=UPI001D0E9440|nr:CBM9 family sugar-binding protein [Hymenobacter translucens]MCC2545581.1 CBM9 family sugar-binding protein [Hymenobacter translucens]